MNYLLNLWRFPILSIVLSSLFLGSLPVSADRASASIPSNRASAQPLGEKIATNQMTSIDSDSIDLLNQQTPTSEVLLAQSVKVNPQLEKQILEVLRRHPEVMFEVLQKYAIEQQAKEQKAQAEAIKQVRTNTKALIGDAPVMGASDRKIVMVEFSDFQCPFCATANKSVKQFMAKHKDKVTLVYKHFPNLLVKQHQ